MESRTQMPTRQEIKQKAKTEFFGNYGASVGVFFAMTLVSLGVALVGAIPYYLFAAKGGVGVFLSGVIYAACSLFASTLSIEAAYFFLRVYRGEKPRVGDFFAGITVDVWRKIRCNLWMYLWAFLWTMLFMLPGAILLIVQMTKSLDSINQGTGFILPMLLIYAAYIPLIIKTLSYSMTQYIVREHPLVAVREGMRISIRMMKGNKAALFMLSLSFFGWILLGVVPVVLGTAIAGAGSVGTMVLTMLIMYAFFIFFLYPYVSIASAGFYDELKRASIAAGVVSAEELGEQSSAVPAE